MVCIIRKLAQSPLSQCGQWRFKNTHALTLKMSASVQIFGFVGMCSRIAVTFWLFVSVVREAHTKLNGFLCINK